MKIIELILDEKNLDGGITAISLVENPAIEENFIALKNQEVKLAEVNKEKRILMGVALIPNKPIFRKGSEEDYYIFFSADTVKKASERFFINGNQSESTLEHKEELKGLTVVESWIVEGEQDKSRMYNLNAPIGSWVVSLKVNNDDIWENYIKTGIVRGFSIEAMMADKMERPKDNTIQDLSKQEKEAEVLIKEITELLKVNNV